MNTRQKNFLREIIANYYGATEEELCALGEISEKTLKSDLQVIASELEAHQLHLRLDHDRIYIPFQQKEEFLNCFDEIMREDENMETGAEVPERKLMILISLCKSDDFVSMNLLADRFYISKTAVSSLIHELKNEIPLIVKNTDIEISVKKGVKLKASEKEIRLLLAREFQKYETHVDENKVFLKYLNSDIREKMGDVSNAIRVFLHDYKYEISNEQISKLIMHTMIIMQRVNKNQSLAEQDVNDAMIYQYYADTLAESGIHISSRELSSLPLLRLNRAVIKHPVVVEIVEDFIQEINEKYQENILLVEDAGPLIAHIDEMLSEEYPMPELEEFVLEQTVQRLLSAYMLAGRLCQMIEEKTGYAIDVEKRAYIAMHVQGLYRKHIFVNEAMLLYDSNISECNMIRTDLEKHFGSKATVDTVYVRWDIEKQLKQKEYAIILGTKSVLGAFGKIPFLKIHPFLTNADYTLINQIVYKNRPVEILKGKYNAAKNSFMYGSVEVKLDQEIIEIQGIRMMQSKEDFLETAVYQVEGQKSFYILNYNSGSHFLVYHRLINRFGQMIKEHSVQ